MLIGLLVVLVIIMILYKSQFGGPAGGGNSGAPGEPQTTLGGAVDRADQTVCRNNLAQLRAAIAIYQGNAGSFPPSLDVLQSGQSLALSCPVGGEPYQYDPNTGAVRCMHPGHASF